MGEEWAGLPLDRGGLHLRSAARSRGLRRLATRLRLRLAAAALERLEQLAQALEHLAQAVEELAELCVGAALNGVAGACALHRLTQRLRRTLVGLLEEVP